MRRRARHRDAADRAVRVGRLDRVLERPVHGDRSGDCAMPAASQVSAQNGARYGRADRQRQAQAEMLAGVPITTAPNAGPARKIMP